jgi:LysR family hydrogen peroxide-inducible transcriptional activator
MITLRQLRYLSAIAETRHFGRAAKLCNVTQPALSMQVQELENILGLQLVERRRNSIDLTPEGREIARRGAAILASVTDLQDYARSTKPVLAGPLRLGIIPSIAPYLLPRALPELHERYPDLALQVRETLTAALVEELVRGDLDLVVAAMPVRHAGIESLDVFPDRFLVARQIGKDPGLRDQALGVCGLVAPQLNAAFGASSLSTVMHLVANGYGVTLLPEMAARTEAVERIQLARFTEPEPMRMVGLAWRGSSARRRDAEALAEVLREVAAPAEP